jgi:hypothetical protein
VTPDPEFVCCATKPLPPELHLDAAWQAALLRPENAPDLIRLAYEHPSTETLPSQSLTMLRTKFWPNGANLTVAFRGGNPATNGRVLQFANIWSQFANVSFVAWIPGQPPDIVVGYDQPGYWSLLGTDSAIYGRSGQTTLNLQGFDSGRMPDSEWYRVVCHEFGHALGAVHEQMRREVVERIDPEACIAYFGRTQGWDRATVIAQILTPVEDSPAYLASPVDEVSIMEYALPKEIMRDKRPVVGGTQINSRDAALVGKAYPGRGVLHPQFFVHAAGFLDRLGAPQIV